MVNLLLYSDQIIPENSAIDMCLLELMKAREPGTRIAYIPSGSEPERRFFRERKAYYTQYGLDLTLFYDLDEPIVPRRWPNFLPAMRSTYLADIQAASFKD